MDPKIVKSLRKRYKRFVRSIKPVKDDIASQIKWLGERAEEIGEMVTTVSAEERERFLKELEAQNVTPEELKAAAEGLVKASEAYLKALADRLKE